MKPRALVRSWKAWGFDHDPPNAALSGDDLDVVVELSKPRVRGDRLHFDDNVAVALGISGGPALVAPAFPNLTTTFPTTGLTYWLSASPIIQPGHAHTRGHLGRPALLSPDSLTRNASAA